MKVRRSCNRRCADRGSDRVRRAGGRRVSPTVSCSPCAAAPNGLQAIWEKIWPGAGAQGPWEELFSNAPMH